MTVVDRQNMHEPEAQSNIFSGPFPVFFTQLAGKIQQEPLS